MKIIWYNPDYGMLGYDTKLNALMLITQRVSYWIQIGEGNEL